MARNDYLKSGDAAFRDQLQVFKAAAPSYATVLGLSATTLAAQAADADYFAYVATSQRVLSNAVQQWTEWRELIRKGGTTPPAGAAVGPTLPTAVPPVDPGVEARFRALVTQIKAHPNYNDAIGKALGIVGTEAGEADLSALQPRLAAQVTGGVVEIKWGWQGVRAQLDMLEIQVDRGDGKGWVMLTFDTTPNYTDTQTPPATLTKWKYRAIYRADDQRVGQWSSEVEVTVGG